MSRRRNKEATREAILAAARTVLASDGPDALSLSKVAHLAGINRGTAYQHFNTREELIKATIGWVSEHLSTTVFGGLGPDVLESVRNAQEGQIFEVITGLVDFAVENPTLCRIWLFDVLSADNPGDDPFFRQFKRATEALAETPLCEEGIDVEALSVLILAGYFLWPMWVNARAKSPEERQEMAKRMRREVLRLSLHGVLKSEAFPKLDELLKE